MPSETESIVRLSVSVPYCQISLFHMNFTSKETAGKKAELLHLLNLIYLDDLYMYFYLCQSDTRHLSLTQQHKTHWVQTVSWNRIFLCIVTYQSLIIEGTHLSDNRLVLLNLLKIANTTLHTAMCTHTVTNWSKKVPRTYSVLSDSSASSAFS